MSKSKSLAIQFIVMGTAVVAIVLLSFASTVPQKSKPVAVEQHEGHSLEELIAEARASFSPELQRQVKEIEDAIQTDRDVVKRGRMYDSLVRYLGRNMQYVYAAHIAEQKAVKNSGSSLDWAQAGERYHASAGFQKEQDHVPPLINAAIRCFNKALELDAQNLDAKTGLGMCLVEGTADPMKGISLLKEVEASDSTHINAQLALADFAVRSQQYDKAIERYRKALRLKPEYYGLHLSMAELFEVKGDTANAIKELELYLEKENDPLVRNNVENAIRQLRAPVQNGGNK
ncbi:MAG: hypothetical protein Fur0041_06200 [Bacteroidia bacterium]